MNEEYTEDAELLWVIAKGVNLQIEVNQLKGLPYDAKKKMPYLEYPDGRRAYQFQGEKS